MLSEIGVLLLCLGHVFVVVILALRVGREDGEA